MTDIHVENEIYLSTEYIKRKGLLPNGSVRIAGASSLCGYLTKTAAALGISLVDGDTANHLWYAVDFDGALTEKTLREIESLSTLAGETVIIIVLNHTTVTISDVIEKHAEMELTAALFDKDRQAFERLKQLNAKSKCLKVVFCDTLLSHEEEHLGIGKILSDIKNDGKIIFSQDDVNRRLSALYAPDAVNAVFTVAKFGKSGNIYNASSFALSNFELKSVIYHMLASQGVRMETAEGTCDHNVSSALSNGKLHSIGFEPVCSAKDALRFTLLPHSDGDRIQKEFIASQYDGKIGGLRALQLDMLRELDRICRKHGIEYFLSGGSMLGAVRHGGFIPWDDDIDVAFLRENYERFRKVAADELDERFLYQTFRNRNGYHYFFDRLTAKNTYFATKYSDGYDMPKGISLDIFVFDKAPKNAYRHWKRLMNKRLVMNVRWKDTARKGKRYYLSKMLLPLLRMKTMDSYSESYDKATRKYEHQNTGYVLPPATDHLYKGSMPLEWFSSVVPARFEDIDTFIPVGYDAYLKIWYEGDYMKPLPLCKQCSYHDYYRLDLGSTVNRSQMDFDFSGELK